MARPRIGAVSLAKFRMIPEQLTRTALCAGVIGVLTVNPLTLIPMLSIPILVDGLSAAWGQTWYHEICPSS